MDRANYQCCNALLLMMIKKAFVNDRFIHETRTLIFQGEMDRISDTLFDHSVIEGK
jgi:hypothetical protein